MAEQKLQKPQEKPPEEEKKKKKKKDNVFLKDKSDLSMTPMIDVTFLLLIFFMVACKFKTFEAKLAAYLPKDKGLENYKIEDQELPIKVLLRWNAPRKQCRVTVGRIFCGYDTEGISKAFRKVKQLKATGVAKAEIEAGGDVHTGWVVQALNMLIKAGLTEINFTGAANPLDG
jgi:biopolymer transport protein ExbD